MGGQPSPSEELAREVSIRRRILSIYNKEREDFATLQEYNDYLEEVEDIIFNLCEGHNVEETEAQVKDYEEKHREEYVARTARKQAQELREQQEAAALEAKETAISADGDSQSEKQHFRPSMNATAAAAAIPKPLTSEKPDAPKEPMSSRDQRALYLLRMRAGGFNPSQVQRRIVEEATSALFML